VATIIEGAGVIVGLFDEFSILGYYVVGKV